MSWKTEAPTRKSVNYLADLAKQAGEPFVYPATKWSARMEIDRLEKKVNRNG